MITPQQNPNESGTSEKENEDILSELKTKLERGEISGKEYNRLVIALRPVHSATQDYLDHKKPKIINYKLIVISSLLMLFFIGCLWYYFYFQNSFNTTDLPTISDDVSSPYSDPIQINFNAISKTGSYKSHYPITMNFKAYYDISGAVTSVHNYQSFDFYSIIVPRDVCIAWGDWLDTANDPNYSYSQVGRSCSVKYQDSRYPSGNTNSLGVTSLSHQSSYYPFSNNHLIPSTIDVRREILSLKRGDKIRIVGYLVDVYYSNMVFKSSTSRLDGGSTGCEIIYVTSISHI